MLSDSAYTLTKLSGDQLLERAAQDAQGGIGTLWAQYQYSIYIRGDNCAKAAKSLGVLDVQELYPDMKFQSLEDFAKEFYALPPGSMDI
jgi:hypothetical protein